MELDKIRLIAGNFLTWKVYDISPKSNPRLTIYSTDTAKCDQSANRQVANFR